VVKQAVLASDRQASLFSAQVQLNEYPQRVWVSKAVVSSLAVLYVPAR